MESLEQRRKQIIWNISLNPISITVKRTKKTPLNGGFSQSESQHGPFIVRLFLQKSGNQNTISSLAGEKQVDNSWGMLADYTADIKSGTDMMDKFDVTGLGCFQISKVNPQIVMGQIAGYQADLEKVS